MEQKRAGMEDFTKIPNGMPGVETRGELIYTYGVKKRRITLAQMCKYLSTNPAKLYGMYPRKGVIAVGSDADIVIYNPKGEKFIRADEHLSACDYAPFEGVKISGGIEKVFLRGKKVVENNNIVLEHIGRYILRKPNSL